MNLTPEQEAEIEKIVEHISSATSTPIAEVRVQLQNLVNYHYTPNIIDSRLKEAAEAIRKIKLNRSFRGKDYVSARGKKVMRRAVGSSGGTCSYSYALNHERNMLSRNKKAKLKGKHRRALGDF